MASDDDVIRLADELASCTQTARILAMVGVFELPEFDQGLMISKRVMITFYHGWNERKTNLKYSLFQTITLFFVKSRKNANFKNHVKNVQLMKFIKPNAYINFVSITFCKQNCASLPSSLFLKTGVKVARFSDNQLQNC